MGIWIKNTDNEPDAVLTLTLIGFVVVVTKVLFAGAVFTLLGRTFSFGTIDASTIGAILTPTLVAYAARRYTDRKFAAQETSEGQQ